MKVFNFLLLTGMICFSNSFSEGFLRTENEKIVDGSGQQVILRGMGLGGWMLQEGYMMQTASFASAQHELKAKIEELIGKTGTDTFYDAWHENHCQKADIDSMAAWGFNCVRLPMHYNLFTLPVEEEPVAGEHTWLEKGFELTDNLLSWCADNEMYLILDLHAAPGGQGKDKAISDYDETKPSLWESAENRAKTVALWKKLAERYAEEEWIGGYDLLNETNWELPGNALLKILYLDITQAIREVDSTHIIFIEGNWFANDFTGLTPPWDDNMVYSFHKYWSHNDQNSIQWMLNIRNTYNIPIWCGESGENSNVWFTEAIRLFETNNIGWAWWPLKKVESISGPLSIYKPSGYQTLLDYWEGNGQKPSVAFAQQALMQLAENSKIQNCRLQKDVIDAMFRQVISAESKPFREHILPGIVPAAEFDFGRVGEAYHDMDVANYQISTGSWTGWNTGWAFRNDGVDIEVSQDASGAPFSVGWIEKDEWLSYTVYIEHTGTYEIRFRVASNSGGGAIQLQLDNTVKISSIAIPGTGGWYNWQDVSVTGIEMPEGEHTIRVTFINSGFNFNQMKFVSDSNGIKDPESGIHDDIQLGQNYPNPFNSSTTIPYTLNEDTDAIISIYDQKGQCVRKLSAGQQNLVVWNGQNDRNVAAGSGVFYYQISAGNVLITKKMLLLR